MASSSSTFSSKHLLLLLFLLVSGAWPTAASRVLENDDDDIDVHQKFKEWTEKYGRAYESEAERHRRLRVFADNLKYVNEFRRTAGANRSYTVGLNQFADLTDDEFLARHTGLRLSLNAATASKPTERTDSGGGSVPLNVDWRTRGAVTAVKNQGSCGSCWAFTAVAAIESALLIKKKQPPPDLSEQELVDCVSKNFGCKGGWMNNAFAFVAGNGGITTEARYPYVRRRGICMVTKLQDHAASITGFQKVPAKDEGALMEAVAQQPVSVSIATGRAFKMYTGGIFDGPCGTMNNHAVTLVGYGQDSGGNKYWIAKNSWGTTWGDKGYMFLKKDVPQQNTGLCGIAMSPSYPTV